MNGGHRIARRFWLSKFLRAPMFALRYRRAWGEWPVIRQWEANDGGL